MKIIDCSPSLKSPGWQQVRDRVRATLKHGSAWHADIEAQTTAAKRMSRTLADPFTALRGLSLPGQDLPAPLVVVGPAGVFAILVTTTRGIFRAKDSEWASVTGQNRYRPAKPNLLRQSTALARAVQDTLRKRGYSYPSVEPVLMAADPGLHVESVHPVARVVLSDGVDRFADSLRTTVPVLSPDEITEIVNLLTGHLEPEIETGIFDMGSSSQDMEIFKDAPLEEEYDESEAEPAPPQPLPGGLSRPQIIFLIVLGALNLLVIAGFVIFLLLSN